MFMKIFVDDSAKPIDKVAIRLKSVNTNLAHIWKALDPMYEIDRINNANEALIVLDDSYEIDSLIKALEEFKRVNRAYIGEWRVVR